MDDSKKKYKVIITKPAKNRYFEVLDYVYTHHIASRAEEISRELIDFTEKLTILPNRGKTETILNHRKELFRFLLYKRTGYATIKIIYYVNEEISTVFITDYFPTEMINTKIKNRS